MEGLHREVVGEVVRLLDEGQGVFRGGKREHRVCHVQSSKYEERITSLAFEMGSERVD